VARDGRVDHEAADLRVLGEDALEDRIVAVGLGDRRLEIVELLCPPPLCGQWFYAGCPCGAWRSSLDT